MVAKLARKQILPQVFGDVVDAYRPNRWIEAAKGKRKEIEATMFHFGANEETGEGRLDSKFTASYARPPLIQPSTAFTAESRSLQEISLELIDGTCQRMFEEVNISTTNSILTLASTAVIPASLANQKKWIFSGEIYSKFGSRPPDIKEWINYLISHLSSRKTYETGDRLFPTICLPSPSPPSR